VTTEVRVGPPVLTINQGSTFMVTDERGEIDGESEQGIFSADTRFVSFYQLYINQAGTCSPRRRQATSRRAST
jgi:N-terminal domain of (some) glycogen debranching enzymes